ncbi:MAG TPA: PocR ligand-binding domain-containing protein [Anaerolineae bacterium]|nr:PocR ligand-binding domain-containing protein [Anaerolineae bacterium]
MSLTDILPLEKWVEFENEINRRSGLDANVYGTDGIRITDNKNWANRLCPAIKATDKGQSFICAVANMNLASQAMNTGKPVIEECDAGLIKIAVPIFAGDEFIGSVGACGLLIEDGEVDTFLINKTTGIDEDKIEGLSRDIKIISKDDADSITDYIRRQINRFVKDYVNKQHGAEVTSESIAELTLSAKPSFLSTNN